jgi:S-adenosyl methyltransferase
VVDDDQLAHQVVRELMDALPVGSYLAMSMPTDEIDPGPIAEIKRQYEARGEVVRFRSKAEVEAFFQGLELVEPGIVQVHKWRPDPDEVSAVSDREANMYGGLARKPGVRGGGRST